MPPHPTVYVRRDIYEKVGYYRLDFGSSADYEWLLRVFIFSQRQGRTPLVKSKGTVKSIRSLEPGLEMGLQRSELLGTQVAYLPKVLVNMRIGGQSNVSIKNRLSANRMDRKAWEVNGIKPPPLIRLLKPMRKLFQFKFHG